MQIKTCKYTLQPKKINRDSTKSSMYMNGNKNEQ